MHTLLLPPNRLRPSVFAMFFKHLDKNQRNFRSEHLRTSPNFHYLDILLSHKYFRHFPLTRNVNFKRLIHSASRGFPQWVELHYDDMDKLHPPRAGEMIPEVWGGGLGLRGPRGKRVPKCLKGPKTTYTTIAIARKQFKGSKKGPFLLYIGPPRVPPRNWN